MTYPVHGRTTPEAYGQVIRNAPRYQQAKAELEQGMMRLCQQLGLALTEWQRAFLADFMATVPLDSDTLKLALQFDGTRFRYVLVPKEDTMTAPDDTTPEAEAGETEQQPEAQEEQEQAAPDGTDIF